MIKFSIIIPVINCLNVTKKCLETIKYPQKEIIIIDNGSKSEVRDYFKKKKNIKYIKNSKNLGVAAAWNQGIKAAKYPYLIFLNNDTLLSPVALSNLSKAIEKDSTAHIISGSEARDQLSALSFNQENSRLVEGAFNGAFFCLSKTLIKKVGYFDEKFYPAYCEDIDYVWRAYLEGFYPLVSQGALFFHHRGVTQNEAFEQPIVSPERYQELVDYFIKKWGDQPYQRLSEMKERYFKTPFNLPKSIKTAPAIEVKTAETGIKFPKDLPDIIIPHHNRTDRLKECLENIPRGFNVYVVRGGSFAENCNKGFKLSKSKRVIFLNDDVILNEKALLEMINKKADIVGASLTTPNENRIMRGILTSWGKGRFWFGPAYDLDQVDFPFGAFFQIKRSVFKKLGMFDEKYRNGYEDVDLFLKAKQLGFTFDYIETPVFHYEAQSEGRYDYADQNQRLLEKRFPPYKVLKILGYKTPLISVLTTKRTTDKILFPESLKNQSYKNFEWIVEEDKFKKGVNYIRNRIVKKAKGEYIFWFDNDIKLEKHCLFSLMIALLQNPNCDWAYCDYLRKGAIQGQHVAKLYDYQELKKSNYISGVSLIRKSIFPKLDEKIERLQDWDWWLELGEKGYQGIYVPETFFTAYYKENDITTKHLKTERFFKQIEIVKNKHQRKPIPYRIYFNPGMGLFGNKARRLWNNEEPDFESPLLFIGLYTEQDYKRFAFHKGKRAVFWNGSDVLGLLKNKHFQEIVLKHSAKHATHNKLLQEELEKVGIEAKIRPLFFGDFPAYPSSFKPGNNVYLIAHPGREKEYGVDQILKIAPKVPEINFHIYGIDGESQQNVIFHGNVPEHQMNNEIKEFQGALRLNKHDGCSQSVLKSILLGQYPITYLPYKYVDNFKTQTELIELLKEIPKKKEPNKKARDYWVNILNNFDWL